MAILPPQREVVDRGLFGLFGLSELLSNTQAIKQ